MQTLSPDNRLSDATVLALVGRHQFNGASNAPLQFGLNIGGSYKTSMSTWYGRSHEREQDYLATPCFLDTAAAPISMRRFDRYHVATPARIPDPNTVWTEVTARLVDANGVLPKVL